MKLKSNETIYHDGGHNAFTGMIQWKGRYWVCFRHAGAHRAPDGKIYVISSSDLTTWDAPATVIDTPEDNRDPKMFVLGDRLHVTSLTIKQRYEMPDTHSGKAFLEDFFSLVSYTEDGIHWSQPRRVWEPFKSIWWTETVGNRVYGSGYLHKPVDDQGALRVGSARLQSNSSEFIASDDGLEWKTLSVISQERQPTECALAFLPDGTAVAFLRHNEEANPFPELLAAPAPYTTWEKIYEFPYWLNGASLGLVGDTLVGTARAFLDWKSTPPEIIRLADPGAVRGLLVMTIDVHKRQVQPHLVLSCPPHPEDDWPDISYAGTLDLGGGRFAMSYYQGLKKGHADIKLAQLALSDSP